MSTYVPLKPTAFRVLAAIAMVGALLALELVRRDGVPGPAHAVDMATTVSADFSQLHVLDQGHIPMPDGAKAAHASQLVAMPPESAAALTAFWFAGDRESAPNVQIAASQWDRATQRWSAARYVVNRHQLGAWLGFGVRRLGNPVAWLDAQQRLHLFVVATGAGGWAASRVLQLRQVSNESALAQLAFEPVRMLPLSWLWNTSFLVRNAPLPLTDGGMVLPVHFELGLKYPEAVRFDRHGEFLGKVRISRNLYALQPSLVSLSPQVWLALLRDQRPNGKIGVAQTVDGGAHWSDLPDLALDNPDAAVAGLGMSSGQLLMAYNPSVNSRGQLDLGLSGNGRDWTRLLTLERSEAGQEFSYPDLLWSEGNLWVSYTHHNKRIAWQRLAPVMDAAK
ncbi:MAG: exo-alpha-sialidase [Rhodoferax sp.]|nr:exo-alpha-sialidase [Rhodoferax sp.]MCF8208994.1 exo-alpha-sialidase [Rhodoferax sp.]